MNEFERTPVTPGRLQPARHFAAMYASEHVAGTEFVIGAMFVAWGVSTAAILEGLLIGNFLAVLTWGLVCAPIATDTRLTLYAYLEKIAGPGIIKLYSLVNGVLFCVLAGAMITVSASAVRILFGIPPEVNWYPTSPAFVLVALVVGAVVVAIAFRGFRGVAHFAEVCAPWMILMFLAGAAAMYPVLTAATPGAGGIGDFMTVGDTHIWRDSGGELGMWHVAAFAWICNLAMHGGLSDMTVLRFARRTGYGYFSALGMFIGHYAAWVFAGIMGAGAALVLQSSIAQLDPGAVAFQALGATGIVAVIIAGWTTSNPTIYRAGLAFQSLNPRWNRGTVTIVTGVVTTVIACFPFVFSRLMDFVGLMGLTLAPVGAVIVAEHWLFPRVGLTRYWNHYRGAVLNAPAVIAWLGSLAFAWLLNAAGLHLFFLLVPTWIAATLVYLLLAALAGAREPHAGRVEAENREREQRQARERKYLSELRMIEERDSAAGRTRDAMFWLAALSLGAILLASLAVFAGWIGQGVFTTAIAVSSIVYFVTGTLWARRREALEQREVDAATG